MTKRIAATAKKATRRTPTPKATPAPKRGRASGKSARMPTMLELLKPDAPRGIR